MTYDPFQSMILENQWRTLMIVCAGILQERMKIESEKKTAQIKMEIQDAEWAFQRSVYQQRMNQLEK